MKKTIKNIAPKVYNRTFIEGVVLTVSFKSSYTAEKTSERVSAFLKEFFYFSKEISQEQISAGFSINNKKLGVSLGFSDHLVGIKLSGSDYTSFGVSVMPYLYHINYFLKKIMMVENADLLTIKKLNAFPFIAIGDNAFDPNVFLKECLSEELLTESVPYKGGSTVLSDNSFSELKFESDDIDINTLFGFRSDDSNPKQKCLLLECAARSNYVKIDDLVETFLKMNSKLFDVFHWCINDGVLNLMNKEE